jgi:hypothetical protein
MRRGERGTVLIMVTVSLTVLFALLGLAIDLGWMYFVKRSAQAAADAGALAAVVEALDKVGQNGSFACGADYSVCQSPEPCEAVAEPATNVEQGCEYTARNGFRHSAGGQQIVSFASGVDPEPPTVPGITVEYWVTATVAERIPASFSAILGRAFGVSSARATAAVVQTSVTPSLILLNRENDCLPMDNGNNACGVNLLVQSNDNGGHYAAEAASGIVLASAANGSGGSRYAGENRGGGTVTAPYTYIRGQGDYYLQGSSDWNAAPTNGQRDGPLFLDPMRGKGQPPAPKGLPDMPVAGGILTGGSTPETALVLPPGNYYATQGSPPKATGEPLKFSGHVRFTNNGSGFGEYVFFGGVENQSAGTVVTLAPGAYYFAGVLPKSNGDPRNLFEISKNMTLKDQTESFGANSDAGELLVFTDLNYPGLEVPPLVGQLPTELRHGSSGFAAGSTDSAMVNLHGLNGSSPQLPEAYRKFAPTVVWQDQSNSVVKYDSLGHIDTSCGNAGGCPNPNLRNPKSARLYLRASPNTHLYGIVYQPRGAWTDMSGGGSYSAPVQLIAGAVSLQGNSQLNLLNVDNPLRRRVVALVE